MNGQDATLELAMELIRRPSVTPEDGGCQELIGARLRALDCEVRSLPFADVSNLWATHGEGAPLLALVGHTDVVPPGPAAAWSERPFVPRLRDGRLYGRGAADMKGGVAAMVTAIERFLRERPRHAGTVALLLTSDEEGPALHGIRRVAEWLRERKLLPDYCLVGEPSSERRLGDVIKHGRRGSLSGRLRVQGRQCHIAYPERGVNPIHAAMPALAELCGTVWEEGEGGDFPPTQFQVSNLRAGTGADNVIPGHLEAMFNFRYSPALSREELRRRLRAVLDAHGLRCELEWHRGGDPFLTRGGRLLDAVRETLREAAGVECRLSTGGGTSDGRFLAPLGAEVLELGTTGDTIHEVDEYVPAEELPLLSEIYEGVLRRLLAAPPPLCHSGESRNPA